MALSAARCPSPRSMAGALSLCDVLLFPVCSRWPSSSPRPRTRGPRLPFPRRAHRGSSECPLTEGRRDSAFQGSFLPARPCLVSKPWGASRGRGPSHAVVLLPSENSLSLPGLSLPISKPSLWPPGSWPRAHPRCLPHGRLPGKEPSWGFIPLHCDLASPRPTWDPQAPVPELLSGDPLPQVDELPARGDNWPLFPPRTRVEGRKRTPLEPRHCPRGRAVLEVRWPRGSAQARLPAATAPRLPEPDATLTGPAAPRS